MENINKTYAETKGRATFDWNAFLNQENYTEEELQNASKLAQEWVTCACGNQCSVIERDVFGEPTDFKLSELGYDFATVLTRMVFYSEIKDNIGLNKKRKDAINILEGIEKRSSFLIKTIIK